MGDFIKIKLWNSGLDCIIRKSDIKDVMQVQLVGNKAVEVRTKSNDVFKCDGDCWIPLQGMLLND